MFFKYKSAKKIILDAIKSEVSLGNFYKEDTTIGYLGCYDKYSVPIDKLNMKITLSTDSSIYGTNIRVLTNKEPIYEFHIFSRKYYNFMKNNIALKTKIENYEKIIELEKLTRGF